MNICPPTQLLLPLLHSDNDYDFYIPNLPKSIPTNFPYYPATLASELESITHEEVV
jgi:hypothetical protein